MLLRRARIRLRAWALVAMGLSLLGMWALWAPAPTVTARVVLVAQEINGTREALLPMRELEAVVNTTFLSKANLLELIEAHNWFPGRHTHGPEYALSELWEQLEVRVIRNYFLADSDAGATRSARIVLTAKGTNPSFVWALAQGAARIVMQQAEMERDRVAAAISSELAASAQILRERAEELQRRTSEASAASDEALRAGDMRRAKALRSQAMASRVQVLRARDEWLEATAAADQPALMAGLTAAGLGLDFQIVDEERPMVSRVRWAWLLLGSILWVAVASVLAALIVALWRQTITAVEDVQRAGIVVFGHLPGFGGDRLGQGRGGVFLPLRPGAARLLVSRDRVV